MQDNSDPDYNPCESEDSDDDHEISSQPESNSRSKSYRTEYDQDSDSHASSGNITTGTELGPKSYYKNDRTSSNPNPFISIIKKQNVTFMFHCSFCNFQTRQRHYLKAHIKSCKLTARKKFWGCPKCKIKFSLKDLVDEHNITEDLTTLGKQVFYCPVCSLEAMNKSEAPILDKVYPSLRHFVCPNCKERLDGADGFKRHLMTKHDVTLLYKCEYCDFSSPECYSLLEHKKSHADLQEVGLIQCSHCHLEFLTMDEFKEHMKKVNYAKMGKELQKDFVETQQRQKSRDLDEEKSDVNEIDSIDLIRDSVETGKWQLRCTLCEYVNYSKESCQRHVKNKHRSSGHSMVKFDKYYENEFKGSIQIGKIKVLGGDDAEKFSTQDLLKILDWTQSDGEDMPEEETIADNVVDNDEVITIEMASDSEDEDLQKSAEDNNLEPTKIKGATAASPKPNTNNGITCKECGYQGKNKLHLSIHQQLMHHENTSLYKCPQKSCTYSSKELIRFKSHLTRYHRVKLDMFYPSNMKCWDCAYTAKKPHHLLLHRQNAHKGGSIKNPRVKKLQKGARNSDLSSRKDQPKQRLDGDTEDSEVPRHDQPEVYLEKDTKKKGARNSVLSSKKDQPKQHLDSDTEDSKQPSNDQPEVYIKKDTRKSKQSRKDPVKRHKEASKGSTLTDTISSKSGESGTVIDGQTGVKYSQLRCKQCGMKHREMYSLAWHMFKSHNNSSALRKWRLKCKECKYEHYSTADCHKHGEQHKISLVRFQKYYMGKLKGAIGFRYKPGIDADDLQKPAVEDNDSETQKDALQVQDEVPEDEIVLREVNKEVDEAEQVENELGNVKIDDSDLFFAKKEEFFTCHQCNYETKDESYIPMHDILVHQPQISSGKIKYQCKDCDFQTKYRHSMRRHLDNIHGYDTDEFYTKEQADLATRKPKETKLVEELRPNHECRLCVFSDPDQYMLDLHMSKVHRKSKEIMKWKLHCSLCDFQSSLRSDARFHALSKHGDIRISKTVKFVKYYDDKFHGYFDFKLDNGNVHYCDKCNDSAFTWDSLRRHYKYCSGRKQEKKFVTEKEENEDFDSGMGEKHEVIEEDLENNTEQDEVIEIEMARDGDNEINKNQDSSQSDEEYEHYESILDEDFNVSKSAEEDKDDSDDQVNENANLSEIDKELQQNNEDITVIRPSKNDRKEASLKSNEVSEDLSDNNKLKEPKDDSKKRSKRLRSTGDKSNNNSDLSQNHEKSKDNAEDSLRSSKRQRSAGIRQISSKNDEDYNSEDDDESSSDSDDEHLKKDQSNDSKRPKTDLPTGITTIRNKCIEKLCSYTSQNKSHLKRHCINVHSYSRKKMDKLFFDMNQYKCDLCKFKSTTLKTMNVHRDSQHGDNIRNDTRKIIPCTKCKFSFRDQYKLAFHRFTRHRDNTEMHKWILRCTLCTYESRSSKYANRHGVMHTSATEPTVVKFNKFYEDKFEGTLDFEYGIRTLHRCTLCEYVAGTWECLSKHLKRHKKKNFEPLRRRKNIELKRAIQDNNSSGRVGGECIFKSPVCPKKELFSDKYHWANHMFEVHGDVSEVMKCVLKCPLCSYETHYTKYAYRHGKAHCSTTSPTTLKFQKKYADKEEGFYICRYGKMTLQRCNLCEFVTTRGASLKRHFQKHKNKSTRFRNKYKLIKKAGANYVVQEPEGGMEVDSDVDETKMNDSGSYSKQQILEIIGLGNKSNDNKTTLSIENNKEENYKISNKNEVITIEIIEDDPTGTDDDKGTTETMNPFPDEFIIEQESCDYYQCSKPHCKYSSDSLKEINNHVKLCGVQDAVPKNKITKKFTCLLCREDLTYRSLLQPHTNVHAAALENPELIVSFSEFTNDQFTCGIEVIANKDGTTKKFLPDKPGKISYKCWMCGTIIVTKKTLENHTNLHAREDGENSKLKVRYSKFVNDNQEGTIIMHADPNYVSRKKKQSKSPEPEYDPSLPVFSCKECNFKSNEEAALNKHKNLHWTAEKDALYKAHKWFTCSVCFFHCFDVGTYKEHCEWHKKRYTGTGGIKTVGKDSWFLK